MTKTFFGVKRVAYLNRRFVVDLLDLEEFDVTPGEADIMRILHAYPDGIARFVLVRLLGVSGPVVSRFLRQLEAKKFIRRTRSPYNGRVVIVHLTVRGRDEVRLVEHMLDERSRIYTRETFGFLPRRELGEADAYVNVFDHFLWQARYANEDTTPLLDPFVAADSRDYDGWFRIPKPRAPFTLATRAA